MTLSVKASYIPRGFSFSSVACGLKKSGLDLGLFVSETPAVAAAMFTTNRVQAARFVCRKAICGGREETCERWS